MKNPTALPRRLATGGLLVASLLVGACASTKENVPSASLATARTAIADAEAAGAMQSAPVELLAARDKLNRAEAAVNNEQYMQARHLAERAEADATVAERKTRAMRAQLAAEELTRSNEALRRESERALTR